MGMFSRISDIVQSNINAMLDKAENPEKVIRLIIQEMEETLVEIRSVAAKNLAEQKHHDRKIKQLEKQVVVWQSKAQLAIEKNRDDLARAALNEKHKIDAEITELAAIKVQLDEQIAAIQDDTARLQSKLGEAKHKQKTLTTRQQNSVARLQAKNVVHSDAVEQAVERFEQYENRVEALEAQVDAFDVVPSATSLEQEFADLEKNDAIEAELEQLKAKLNNTASTTTKATKSTKASTKKAA